MCSAYKDGVDAGPMAPARPGLLRQFVNWLESGERTPADLVKLCLDRIRAEDERLHAWVEVAPQPALAEGPLTGIPFAAKDIYETRNLSTAYGSPIYAGRKGATDAALITQLRNCGAVLLGKTQTTAFAYLDPAPTRNPHHPSHTPGGSSSGSAAAVAAGMAPFALGTQTQGSVLRPASFCGVVGFKPTFGLLPLDGVLPFAPSLDTAGLFTQTADDMQWLWGRMGKPEAPPLRSLAVPDLTPGVDPAMQRAFGASVEILSTRFSVHAVATPPRFPELLHAARCVNNYEGARTHQGHYREHGARIGHKLAQLVEDGLRIPLADYQAALHTIVVARREMADLFRQHPVWLTPAARGPAPLGLESTGDPVMNAPWTALGVPAISIPMPVGKALPLGLQLVADAGSDSSLVALAAEVECLLQ